MITTIVLRRRPPLTPNTFTISRGGRYRHLENLERRKPRFFSDKPSSSASSSPSSTKTNTPNNNDTVDNNSKTSQLVSSLTESASAALTKATSQANSSISSKKLQQAAQKTILDATTSLSTKARHSLTSAKLNAKERGEQMAWEAKRKLDKNSEVWKEKAGKMVRDAGEKTKEKVQDKLSEGMQHSKEYFKGKYGSMMEKLPKIPEFPGLSSNSKISEIKETILKKSIPQSASSQLKNAKAAEMTEKAQDLTKSILTSKTTQTITNNLTSKVQETISKTTRWLWWWGLAAVGVYGISTTLTKEGMSILKDLVGISSKSTSGNDSGGDGGKKSLMDGAKSDGIVASPIDSDGYLDLDTAMMEVDGRDGVGIDRTSDASINRDDTSLPSSSWASSLKGLIWRNRSGDYE